MTDGEKVFAFCFAGFSIAGELESLTGFVTAKDAATAKQKAAEGIAASDFARHPKAPATSRRLWVWELPPEMLAAAHSQRPEP